MEILLFGKILGKLSILGSFYILNKSSWNKNIKEHLETFIKINSETENNLIKQEREKYKKINLSNFRKNKDIPKFLIKLLEEYYKMKGINDGIIDINTKYSSSRNANITDLDTTENTIDLDADYVGFRSYGGKDCRSKGRRDNK